MWERLLLVNLSSQDLLKGKLVNQVLTDSQKNFDVSQLFSNSTLSWSPAKSVCCTGSVWLLSVLAGKSEHYLTDIFDEIFHSQACLRLVQFVILSSHFSPKTDNCLELKFLPENCLIYTTDRWEIFLKQSKTNFEK